MVKTSSTGIKNGLSTSRSGSGMCESHASISLAIDWIPYSESSPSRDLSAEPRTIGVSAGNSYFSRSSDSSSSTRSKSSSSPRLDHVALVQVHDQRRDVDLTSQKNVLAGLRHRAVRGAHNQYSPVHLSSAGDHVLDVVSVARAIDVRVVPLVRLVLHVRRRDRDAAGLLLRSLVDLVERGEVRQALGRLGLGDRRSEGGLAVVDVTDRADVDVRLVPDEFFFGHR